MNVFGVPKYTINRGLFSSDTTLLIQLIMFKSLHSVHVVACLLQHSESAYIFLSRSKLHL
jgi:hypothetical protein